MSEACCFPVDLVKYIYAAIVVAAVAATIKRVLLFDLKKFPEAMDVIKLAFSSSPPPILTERLD
jgi:hypothetical protein